MANQASRQLNQGYGEPYLLNEQKPGGELDGAGIAEEKMSEERQKRSERKRDPGP